MKSLLVLMSLVSVTLHIPGSYRTMTGVLTSSIGTCSGVIIDTNKILTAAHCMDDSKGVAIVDLPSGDRTYAIVIKKSAAMDLALLGMLKKSRQTSQLGKRPEITNKLFTINSGKGIPHTYGEGYLRNVRYIKGEDAYPLLMSSILIEPGASGSGVFDGKGRLVGINIITTDTGSLAVHIDTIKRFLKDIKR